MGATGYVLTIPQEVLEKLEKADGKINQIAKSSELAQDRFRIAFSKMANYVDPLIKQLTALKGLNSLKIDATFKRSATEAEKTAAGVAGLANQLNKVAESPLDTVNKKLESMRKLLDESMAASQKLADATKGVVISRDTLSSATASAQLMPDIQGQIKYLELERAELLQSNQSWKQYIEQINKTSLASQKQQAEMDRLNASFRSGKSLLQQRSKAEDDFGKAVTKAVVAMDKAAKAEERKNNARANKANQEAARAEEQYARALAKSEATIVQRARKIETLTNAQRALNQTGRDYSSQLSRIASETQRLQKANRDAINTMQKFKNSQSSVLNITDQLTRKLALLFSVSAIQGYVEKLISVRGEFELQQRALQAILQNKDEANAIWEKTVALAIRSPFQVKELVTYTKQLAAYRIESDKLYDTTKMLADVSAGLGVDMGRLILAYGQVKAANYLRASEVRQFTEAGVGLLQELADMYTELEGRMVSVGEVQSRITKRMVTFGDVEEIFKRITSAGGIFYNMQEIQAETLAGMISNLKDNFDVMFNEIGKANDGVLKGFINIINNIVSNWRVFANILNSASLGFIAYTAKVLIAAKATDKFTASNIRATTSTKGLVAITAKLSLAFRDLNKFISKNPYLIIGTALAGVAFALYDNYKQVENTRKSYDTLTSSLDTQIDSLDNLISKIEEQNKVQQDAKDKLEGIKKGTEEYTKVEREVNKEQRKFNDLLDQLRKQFPDVYNGISNQKNAIDELRESQEKYNKELRETQILNDLLSKRETFFGIGFKEAVQEYGNAATNYDKAAEKTRRAYNTAEKEISRFFSTNAGYASEYKKQFDEIANSPDDTYLKAKKLNALLLDIQKSNILVPEKLRASSYDLSSAVSKSSFAFTKLKQNLNFVSKAYHDFIDDILTTYGYTENELKNLSEQERISISKSIKETLLATIGEDNKAALELFSKSLDRDYKIKVSFDKKETKKELDKLQQQIADGLKKIMADEADWTIKLITPEEDATAYIDGLYKQAKALADEAERARRATENLYVNEGSDNETEAKILERRAKILKAFAESYGASDKQSIKAGESAYEKRLKAQLDLLKKLQTQYEKLRQTQGDKGATDTLTSSFGDAYQKLFNKPLSIKFDKASIADEMASISSTISGKSAEALKRSWDSEVGRLRSEISVTATIENIESFERDIASMFNSYQLSIDLQAKGVPTDVIESLFGIDVTTLDDIKKALEEKYPDLGALGEKQLDSYFKIQKQIADYEKKELQNRINRYISYLKDTMNKRLQIEMEYQEKINKIPNEFTSTQRNEITQNLQKEKQQKIDKQTWDEFTNSSYYKYLFEDLNNVSSRAIETLLAKMKDLRSSLSDLPASDLKAIVTQINKMENELRNRNPFKDLVPNIKEYINLLGKRKELEEDLIQSSQKISQLEDEVSLRENAYRISEKEYNLAVKTHGADSEQAQKAESKMKASYKILQTSREELKNQEAVSDELTDQLSKAEKLKVILAAAAAKFSEGITAANDILGSIQNTFGGMMSKSANDSLSSTQEILGGVQGMVSGAGKLLSGDYIGGTVSAIKGLIGSIGGIFGIGDKKKERQIQREIELVENLQRAYEKLKTKIENAYTIDTLNLAYENAEKNLKAQNESFERMIAAEEDKKDTDDERIKEWRQAIDDNNQKIEELKQQKTADLGGFGSGESMASAAEEFVSAWLDAYRETGDGLDALTDKWDDFISNIVVKQMALRGIEKFLKPVMELIDNSIGEDSYLSTDEMEKIKNEIDKTVPKMNEFFKTLYSGFEDMMPGQEKEDNGTTMSKAISGISEDTAGVIEAYLNSMRFFVADSNMILNNLYAAFISIDPMQNPMYSELSNQTKLLRSIDDRLASVITYSGDHPNGGASIKVLT